LAERALRKWLDEIENINPATLTSSDLFAIVEKRKDETTGEEVEVLIGGVAKRWLDIQRPNLKQGTIQRRDLYIRSLAQFFKDVPLLKSPPRIVRIGDKAGLQIGEDHLQI
jgi:hypothetical protein